MTLILICLGDASNDYHSDILKLLGILMSNKMTSDTKCRVLQEDFDIPMTQNLERKVGLMCNLSEGVFAKGVEYERENSARKEKEWQAEREALTAENSNLSAENLNLSAENLRLQKQLEDLQRKLQQA